MKRALVALAACVAFVPLAACGGAQASAPSVPGAAIAVGPPDVELRDADAKEAKEAKDPTRAFVGGREVAMDGIAEGLAWPALRAAVARKPGDHAPLTVSVARSVPVNLVMRAVWTLRDADLRLQTTDPAGTPHVLELRPKPDAPASGNPGDGECHLAVFVTPDGNLRVASPGGPHLILPPDASGALARALASERAQCTIRYVAFGADSADAPWSSVFDVAQAVDRDKSAGDARYVLGEPIHIAGPAPR